jgi:hypothetical protein
MTHIARELKINRGINLQNKLIDVQEEVWLVFISMMTYLAFFAYMKFGLKHDFLIGDAGAYWRYSFNLSAPFSTWWVPGYPFAIALLRTLSFNQLSPVAVLMALSATFYAIQVVGVYSLLRELNVTSSTKVGFFYAIFPIVGLTYTVHPIADSMATGLLVLTMLYFVKEKWSVCAVYLSMTMLTHKATWFFLLPLIVIAFWRHKEARVPFIFAVLPLGILIVAGAFYHRDLLWFMRWSTENLLTSQSSLPILDGVISSVRSADTVKKLKGLVVLTIFLGAFYLLLRAWHSKFWLGIAISFGLVTMALVVNQLEVFALVRFGKVIVIPAAYFFLSHDCDSPMKKAIQHIGIFASIVGAEMMSNFAFAYYASKIFWRVSG